MAAGSPTRSSGDLVADRRYEWARGYAADGDHAAAADVFAQVLDLVPDYVPALVGHGEALAALGDRDGAAAAFRQALAADPADIHGVSLKLSALGLGAAPAAPPAAYVRGLFDDYADRFDKALVETLEYRTPGELGRLLRRLGPETRFVAALDLGCGTGLMGAELRPWCDRLVGVDLSAAMVAKAQAKAVYDALAVAGIIDYLGATAERFDAVAAADVFVYCGDLGSIVAAVAARLDPGGLFLFSVEAADEPDVAFQLRDSLRYAHGEAAVAALLGRAGFAVEAVEATVLRLDRGRPIAGRLFAARRL